MILAGLLSQCLPLLNKANDTNVTLTLGGTPSTALLQAVSITAGWTGTLAVSRGGTAASTASGTSLDNITGFSSTGFLTRTGSGTYVFQSTTNGISLANIAQLATVSIIGNPTGSTANMEAITLGSTLNFSGTTLNATTATSSQLGASSPDNVTITASTGVYAVKYPTSGDLMLSAGNGAVPTAYAGTSSAGNVITALSAAGAGSFLAYGLTGNNTLVQTTSGVLLTASLLPAATTSVIGGVIVGTGLSVISATITPTFGTATNQVAEGGVITGAGPTGSATVVPIITYNAAGQLTTVTTATIAPAIGSITGLGTGVATALGDNTNATGGFPTVPVGAAYGGTGEVE